MKNNTIVKSLLLIIAMTLIISSLFSTNLQAQAKGVVIGENNLEQSAVLELHSDNKGFLIPRMTTLQRDAIPGPATGLIIYNTDNHILNKRGDFFWHELDDDWTRRLNPGDNTAAQDIYRLGGNVGIGIGNPDVRFQIGGGTDITPIGGGYLQVGGTSALNIAIDDNEIMARNNGAIADLYVNIDGGHVLLTSPTPSVFGNVGIGTGSPSSKLDVLTAGATAGRFRNNTNTTYTLVVENTASVNAPALQVDGTTSTTKLRIAPESDGSTSGLEILGQSGNRWNMNMFSATFDDIGFWYNGIQRAYLRTDVDVQQLDFTAQHRSMPSIGIATDFKDKIGMIVSSDGKIYNLDGSTTPSISESLPHVVLSDKAYDKSIYGVIAGIEDPETEKVSNTRSYTQGVFATNIDRVDENDYRLIINSGGEGGIWVSNYNGNIENGDLVVTAPIPGIGMKQDDDLIHNYTVAKIVMDCDFDLNAENYECKEISHEGKTYRMAFLACVYKCN